MWIDTHATLWQAHGSECQTFTKSLRLKPQANEIKPAEAGWWDLNQIGRAHV
jgi:hypothetical protein